MNKSKPFNITKRQVWEAYLEVKSNDGGAGVDGQTIEDFEQNLKDNLYCLWNRLASGSYFAPPVKAVPTPKKSGGERILGIPTVSDRIAQTVAKAKLETMLEPVFDADSYGYRPNRSAHDAVAITRKRCWRYDWVVEFDIRGLFDNIDHGLLMKALRHHCNEAWIVLYIQRWIETPLQHSDSTLESRQKGTPQGGVVSPLLANLFLHYAFDAWARRELLAVPFCRYADDGLLHCRSESQARLVLKRVAQRFKDCGLEIHPDKSGIVYCQDDTRREEYSRTSFDFLGFTFRPRRCVNKDGRVHPNFLPGISNSAKKVMNRQLRSWHIQLKNDKSLVDLSKMFNPVLRGWYGYYGRFYPSALRQFWRNVNAYLVRWVRRKWKRYAYHRRRAKRHLSQLAVKNPNLFIPWKLGVFPMPMHDRSRMS